MLLVCVLVNLTNLFAATPMAELKKFTAIEIDDIDELQLIGVDPGYPLDGSYYLSGDIDASGESSYVPIGTVDAPFNGTFLGNNHALLSFSLVSSSTDYCGVFRALGSSAIVQDLDLLDVNVSVSNRYTGALVGTNAGTISNCHLTGNVKRNAYAPYRGGLVGENAATGVIDDCSSSAVVTGRGGALEVWSERITVR